MSISSHSVLADQKHQHNSVGGSGSTSSNNNNNTNKPTNDLAQIEKIRRIVQREILDHGRHLFQDGRWPSDGVGGDPRRHPEPYTAAMRFGGRDPSSKKRPGLTKRPPNMWMIFRMHAASVVMEEFPEVNQAALTSVLAPIWQSVITLEEKDMVREESERLKEYHKLQFPEWKYKPRQKKRTAASSQQQQQQQQQLNCDTARPVAKRECLQHGGGGGGGGSSSARCARQQQQHQQQSLHHQQHQHQHQHHMMQDAASPYLSSGSPPDVDHIDGLQLPLSVDTSPATGLASAAPASGGSAAAAAAAVCLPFSSPWSQHQHQHQHQQHHHYLVATTTAASSSAATTTSPEAMCHAATQHLQQHHQQQQHQQQQQQTGPKDPTLRSILAASAPSSASSSGGIGGGGGGDLSCLPDLLLHGDYFSDFALPDLEAYLSPEGCSGGPVADPAPLPQSMATTALLSSSSSSSGGGHACDFSDPRQLAAVKQEFVSYAIM